jgi:hypothetical protein
MSGPPALPCVLRLRPAHRAVLIVAATFLSGVALSLPWLAEGGSHSLAWAGVAFMLLLAWGLLVPVWRQRVQIDAHGITVTPGYGRRRHLTAEDIAWAQLQRSSAADLVGGEVLCLQPSEPRAAPVWVHLQVFSTADQQRLIEALNVMRGEPLATVQL